MHFPVMLLKTQNNIMVLELQTELQS